MRSVAITSVRTSSDRRPLFHHAGACASRISFLHLNEIANPKRKKMKNISIPSKDKRRKVYGIRTGTTLRFTE
jgi:hypothetical protein